MYEGVILDQLSKLNYLGYFECKPLPTFIKILKCFRTWSMCTDLHMDDTFLLVVHNTLCKQKPSYWEVATESRIVNDTCKQKQQNNF